MVNDAQPKLAPGRLAFIVACSVVGVVLPFTEHPARGAIPELWPPMTVFFVWFTLVCEGNRRPSTRVLRHAGVMFALFVVLALLLGSAPLTTLRMGVVNVVAALVMAYLFQRTNGGWALHSPRSIYAVMVAAVGAGLVAALLGGFPGFGPFELDSRLLMWWVIRNGVFMFVGASTFMVLFHTPQSQYADRSAAWWELAVLAPFSIACVWLVYEVPGLPLSWMLLLPGIAAGLIFDVFGAALAVLSISVLSAAFTMLPGNQFGYEGLFPASVVVDLLVIVMAFLALQLSLVREQRATVMGDLRVSRAQTRSQASFLTQVLDSMNDGVIVVGQDGTVAYHNPAARQLLGKPLPASARETSWIDHFGITDAEGAPVTDQDLVTPLSGTEPDRTLLIDNPGSKRFIQAGVATLETDDGPATMVLFSDVTAQRARFDELAAFARVVAHDLRTPLTGLNGWIELAREDLMEGRWSHVEAHLTKAQHSGGRMTTVIEDWLAYSIHRDGRLTPTVFELAPVVQEVLAGYHPQDARAGSFDVDVSHRIEADPALVRQLLANLVGNAMKYVADDRRPELLITSHADDEQGWVRVDVRDRGIGIPRGQEEMIFDEFHRAPEHAEDFGGSGLGLSLCKQIVNRHGGRISAASNDPDHGTTFSFTLPAA
ncbi:MAG: PAS domain-containing protein [Nocardioides sp.]|nr:PAS domain-containing protein [Nocardioides sp.]